jgi:hypothetical protein
MRTRARLAAAATALCLAAACGANAGPIRVHEGTLEIENQTDRPWRDVTVTMNAYYVAKAPALEPHARLDAPLANFMNGWGQRFDAHREAIRTIVVRATTASGDPVELTWSSQEKNLAEQLRSTGKK